MKNKNLQIVLLVLLSATLGCRLLMNQAQTNFFEKDAAQKAANAVKSKVGFSFKVQEVEITENTFKMKIQSPGDARKIDEYTYLGFFVSQPQPVQRDAMTDVREKISFDEIDFTVVSQIAKNALDKTQIEGGTVKRMTLGAQDGRKFRWRVEIQGTRETASAWEDIAGNITSVDLSQTNRAASYTIFNEAELTEANNAIKAKFGENVRFEEIIFRENSLELKVINSENPKMVDGYNFGISGFKKSSLPPMPANSIFEAFPLSSINFNDALDLALKAKQRLDLPNGQLNHISFDKENSGIYWKVLIEQGANGGLVSYDEKLNEISIQKN